MFYIGKFFKVIFYFSNDFFFNFFGWGIGVDCLNIDDLVGGFREKGGFYVFGIEVI